MNITNVIEKKVILRPSWAEIDLSKIASNLQKIKQKTLAEKIMLVVKCDAYGHGACVVSKYAEENNLCDFLGVASVEEGMELRQSGIKLPVLVLGSIYPFTAFEYALHNDLSVTIASLDAAEEIIKISNKLNIKAKCHIKADTGMNRIGTRKEGILKIAKLLNDSPNIILEGIYSHFSCAHNDKDYTKNQIKNFEQIIKECEDNNIFFKIKHIANSYGGLNFGQAKFDMIRTGLAAYGIMHDFEKALALKSKIVFLKTSKKGSKIGYDNIFTCDTDKKIATISLGYGDGYLRQLSNKADVLIHGKKCRIVGNISMDMMTVDVSEIKDVKIGDEVVLIGKSEGKEISSADLANLADTNSYSIICNIGKRIPRIYKK